MDLREVRSLSGVQQLVLGGLVGMGFGCAAPDSLSREGTPAPSIQTANGSNPDQRRSTPSPDGQGSGDQGGGEPGAGVRADADPDRASGEAPGASPGGPLGELFLPSILRPAPDSADPVLAQIEGIRIRKRHVFDRLFEIEPRRARQLLVDLENDVRVMAAAKHHEIRVDAERVEHRAAESEATLRAQLERELDDGTTFEGYLRRQKDLALDEYRRLLRLSFARQLYREYVVRYLALREERVKVRILAHRDRRLMGELAGKVRAGADFADAGRAAFAGRHPS